MGGVASKFVTQLLAVKVILHPTPKSQQNGTPRPRGVPGPANRKARVSESREDNLGLIPCYRGRTLLTFSFFPCSSKFSVNRAFVNLTHAPYKATSSGLCTKPTTRLPIPISGLTADNLPQALRRSGPLVGS